jgi:DNA-binding beta-propeller fold protein YncE
MPDTSLSLLFVALIAGSKKGYYMLTHRTSVICTIMSLCVMLFASCSSTTPAAQKATGTINRTPAATAQVQQPATTPIIATATPTHNTTPQQYTSRVFSRGVGRPDDMAFDLQGRVLFSDFYNGTVSRLNSDGSVTVLLRGLAGPEGLIVLSDGTMIIAEQNTNRILMLARGAAVPTVLRTLPGTPSASLCDKHGVDGIAFDSTTNTIIVPDSPTGNVYRMSLDGKMLMLLASNIPRPVGAAVDGQGNIYVADECGGALYRIAATGTITRTGGFGMLDDVALDPHGNVLVTDLLPSIHALIRIDGRTGKRVTLASRGFIEPQGLLVGGNDTIYVSDDYADIIVEYTPV